MKDFIVKVAREAGELALSYRKDIDAIRMVRKRTEKDLVTEADQAVEAYIRRQVEERYPGHAFTGEEQGSTGESDYRWIVDPIDGTISFFHGQHFFSVSIALVHKGETTLAAVYAPALDELFFAEKGKGAFLNGNRISVSSTREVKDAVAATGFCCIRDGKETDSMEIFARMVPVLRDFRRSGSAALDLCHVACGRLDAYWERCLNIYDVAAGLLIVEEAGGTVTDYRGNREQIPSEIAATNGLIQKEFLKSLYA